jgi:hypothetical protein
MPAAERKRPWYLVLALLGALALGTTGACSGWTTVALYREPIDPSFASEGISDDADQAAVVGRMRAYLQTLDAAKRRGWPIGVATMLLGGAVFVFAMRAMGGNGGARVALIQLVVAQAGVHAAAYWLMRDVFEANLRLFEAKQAAEIHEHVPERPRADDMARAASSMMRAANPIVFALRSLGSALVVVALTRRRSREFFRAAGEAVEER